MCGIVGYAGNVRTACGKPLEVCLQGLQRLEYRGYDSAGVALTAPGMERVAVRKKAGRLANLVQDIERDPMPDATVGIGHTRWATNGVPNDTNAHPHTSRDGKVAIIHNGIIENASQLRLDLQTEGYRFVSETDTEVAAKLLGKISDKIIEETGKPDLFKAIRRLARMLEGAFTILATDVRQPDIVVWRPSRFAAGGRSWRRRELPRLRRGRVRGLHQARHGNRPGSGRDGVRR